MKNNLKKQIASLKRQLAKQKSKHEQYMAESIKWGAIDFVERAKEIGYTIRPAKAQECLEEMIRRHDCNFGITWETLDYYIQENGTEK